jgi:CxxC-x17-CxxC domain-containing protein
MNPEDITVVGQTNFRGQQKTFGIYSDDRRRHLYIVGKTGVGKTTLMANMIRQDIERGRGVALVDPHGDLASSLLDVIPAERINDVIYFDPADVEYPIAFNVLEAIDPQYKYLVSSGLIGSLKKIWADSWGPRLEYILRNTILALLDYPSSTMLGISRMLGDSKYRKKVVERIQDPVVKSFWINEFANYNERFRSEAISPIQNKVGQFLTSSIIRNIVAQPKSTIDMQEVMDQEKILLINASKGRIGEDNSALLGAMLITRIQLAAMDRARMLESKRKDFFLYVDEFQNFATESFAGILSEARKYRLNLTIAHQYITQMEEPVRDAVFGNAGTLVSFRVGAADAEFLENEFAPQFTQTDLVNLDKFNAYIKLMISGITSKPFSMQTIPPAAAAGDKATRETVIRVSRERYAHRREIVEGKIARWSGVVFSTAAAGGQSRPSPDSGRKAPGSRSGQPSLPAPDQAERQLEEMAPISPPQEKEEITDLAGVLAGQNTPGAGQIKKTEASLPETERHDITCARCGKQADVPFLPAPGRPAYCKACFAEVKHQQREEQLKPGATRQRASAWRGPSPPSLP